MRRVLLCVPCFNAEPFLAETLDSIAAQDADDWRCIVVDDGSTDGSARIAEDRSNRDPRFTLIRHTTAKQGVGAARNTAIKAATDCTFVLPVDADDRIAPSYVRRAREVLETNPNARIVYAEAELFGEQTGRWELAPFSIERMLRSNVIYCSAMFRRSSWEAVGGYAEKMPMAGFEDWDLWLGILEREPGEVIKLAQVLFFYRVRTGSMSTDMLSANDRRAQTIDIIMARHHKLFARTFGPIHRTYLEQIDLRNTMLYRGRQLVLDQVQRSRRILGAIKRRVLR